MKALGTISLAVLFLLMTGSVATYSQSDSRPSQTKEEKDKPKANDNKKQEDKAVKKEGKAASKPEKKQEQARKQEKEQPGAKQEQHHEKNAAKQEQKQQKQEQKEQRSGRRAEPNQRQQPVASNQDRRIPDDKFRKHFGREHTFRVHQNEVVNVAQPVVVYEGYDFQLENAWPANWGFDDDCYIDYEDGGYFLFDVFHPGIRIAVFIVG